MSGIRFLPLLLLILSCQVDSRSIAATVILNEYNAVGSSNFLDASTHDENAKEDPYFATFPEMPDGRIQGNGGNWFELVVVEDNVDMRGWELRWAEHESLTGTRDIWLGAEPSDDMGILRHVDQGIITFSAADVWSGLRAGTIITVSEQELIGVWTEPVPETRHHTQEGITDDLYSVPIVLSTDTSYAPEDGDWWIHVSTLDELDSDQPLVTAETNVELDGAGNFSVGKDTWRLTIMDASGRVVFGPAGEGGDIGELRGVNGREVGKLEEDPSPMLEPSTAAYNDGSSSTFGAPNVWGGGEFVQDFGILRGLVPQLQAGDADQNLEFDQKDLVSVQIAAKYISGEAATWGEGDWNGAPGGGPGSPPTGDGLFDQKDIVAALQSNVYLAGPYAGISVADRTRNGQLSVWDDAIPSVHVPVPEPTTILLLACGFLACVGIAGTRITRDRGRRI